MALYHVLEDAKCFMLVMELCKYGTLKAVLDKRKSFTELEVKYFGAQLVSALTYLETQQLLHRDVCLSNLLLGDKLTLKLIDFEFCKLMRDAQP